jgi:hypothetical protein
MRPVPDAHGRQHEGSLAISLSEVVIEKGENGDLHQS